MPELPDSLDSLGACYEAPAYPSIEGLLIDDVFGNLKPPTYTAFIAPYKARKLIGEQRAKLIRC